MRPTTGGHMFRHPGEHAASWLERYAEPSVEPLLEEAVDLIKGA